MENYLFRIENSGFRVKIKKYSFFNFSRNDRLFLVPASGKVPFLTRKTGLYKIFDLLKMNIH